MAQYDPATERVHALDQHPDSPRQQFMICNLIMGIPYNKLRVIVPGHRRRVRLEGLLYQDGPLMLFLAKEVGRPVNWVDTREGLSVTTVHSRGQQQHAHAGGQEGRHDHRAVVHQQRRLRRVFREQRSRRATGADRAQHHRRVCDSESVLRGNLAFANTVIARAGARRRPHGSDAPDRAPDRSVRARDRHVARRRAPQEHRPAGAVPVRERARLDLRLRQYVPALDRALEMAGATIDEKKKEARARGKRLGMGIGSYM